MKYFFSIIFMLLFNIAYAQNIKFDSLCNVCKAEFERINWCKLKFDTFANYSAKEISHDIIFYKLLEKFLQQNVKNTRFNKLIRKSVKNFHVFMKIDYFNDSADLRILQYYFQSKSYYGDIVFSIRNNKIMQSALSIENRQDMICKTSDSTPLTGKFHDYDYYRLNIFPILGTFCNNYDQCAKIFTANYFQIDKLILNAKRENVRRFGRH